MVLKNDRLKLLNTFLFTLFFSLICKSEVMFEGYYTIRSGGVHSGYVIQQYNFDSKKKQFSIVYYIRTNQMAGNITESLKAVSNDKFEPLNYQYTSKIGDTIQTIDAVFKQDNMSLTVSDGKIQNKIDKKIPKGTFLASFLNYMLLSKGLANGKSYDYQGIAEERGEVLAGKVLVQEEIQHLGLPAFRLFNEYGGPRYISVMTKNGEVLHTKSPVQAIETELVVSPAEATKGFVMDTKVLKILFGSIPTGKINQLYKIKNSIGQELTKSGGQNAAAPATQQPNQATEKAIPGSPPSSSSSSSPNTNKHGYK